jgi:hypothetical protein
MEVNMKRCEGCGGTFDIGGSTVCPSCRQKSSLNDLLEQARREGRKDAMGLVQKILTWLTCEPDTKRQKLIRGWSYTEYNAQAKIWGFPEISDPCEEKKV